MQTPPPATGEVLKFTQDDPPRTLLEALTSGTTSLDFRYRFEAADVSSVPERAWASTLRTALGYETAPYQGLSGFVEFESIDNIFDDESIRGDERLRAHFLDARYDGGGLGQFAAYGMLVDFEESEALSSRTIGARAANTHDLKPSLNADVALGWTVEYAQQVDAANNPVELDQDYLLIEGHASLDRFRITVASETLGGSGQPGDKLSERSILGLRYADFNGDDGFADVTRVMAWVTFLLM